MAGNNSRIHGYNPLYRSAAFHAFDEVLINQRRSITQFVNQRINYAGPVAILDHQGHIIPQNLLNAVLDPIMEADGCTTEAKFDNLVQATPWMTAVRDYGTAIHAPMFDWDANDPEDRTGGFFSIVTWNPVNLCRAPEDARRRGYPGNTIDNQVMAYITMQWANIIDQQAQLHMAGWVATLNNWIRALHALSRVQSNDNITAYIAACSSTLPYQLHSGFGYYTFPWSGEINALDPGQFED